MALAYRYTLPDGYFAGAVNDHGLLPSNATYEAPVLIDGFMPRWTGEAWEQVEDHKSKEGYLDGQPHTIKEYGPLPEGWSDTPPPPTLEEMKTQASTALRTKRKEIEYGGVLIDGQLWDSAEKDELRLNSVSKLFETGALTEYAGWKVSEGVYIILTPDVLEGATLAFMRHYGNCFAVEAAKLAEIDALEDVEAVKAWLETTLNQGW